MAASTISDDLDALTNLSTKEIGEYILILEYCKDDYSTNNPTNMKCMGMRWLRRASP